MDEKMQVKVFWFYHPEETIVDSNFGLPYPVSDKHIKNIFHNILNCNTKFL